MKNPRVSIIIPTFNRAGLLAQTITSVLQQSFTDLELIIVDDGSTDNTKEVVSQFAGPIKYIYQEKSGRSYARNSGYHSAAGDYICFLDSDDLLGPDAIRRQVEVLDNCNDIGFVYCGFNIIDQNGVACPKPMNFEKHPPQVGRIFQSLLYFDYVPPMTMLVRREHLESAGLFDPDFEPAEDYDWLLRLSRSFDADYIPDELTSYRIHIGSTSSDILQAATVRVLLKHLMDAETRECLGEKFRPVFRDQYRNIANYYYNHGEPGRALIHYGKAIKVFPLQVFNTGVIMMMIKSLVAQLYRKMLLISYREKKRSTVHVRQKAGTPSR